MTTTDHLDFAIPTDLRERGTVVVLPGRGETPAVYHRFGRRIAADAYRVRILAGPFSGDPPELATRLVTGVADLGEDLTRPLVLVGVDASAAALAALVATDQITPVRPDAVVLAGLPGHGSHDIGPDWASELAVRTHCPTHRAVLGEDESFHRGALADPVGDDVLDLAYDSTSALPHLILVGDSDPIADQDALARLTKALPVARLVTVREAHHDVLNDLQHRSVAAETVGFLEALRNGPPLRPIISVKASTW